MWQYILIKPSSFLHQYMCLYSFPVRFLVSLICWLHKNIWLTQNSSILTWGIVEYLLVLCNRKALVQFLLCMDDGMVKKEPIV